MTGVGDLVSNLVMNSQGFLAGLKVARSAAQVSSESIGKSVEKIVNKTTSGMSRVVQSIGKSGSQFTRSVGKSTSMAIQATSTGIARMINSAATGAGKLAVGFGKATASILAGVGQLRVAYAKSNVEAAKAALIQQKISVQAARAAALSTAKATKAIAKNTTFSRLAGASFFGNIGAGIAASITAHATGFVTGSIGNFRTDLQAMQKLRAVLEATGGAAELTAQEISNYASELQNATNFGDEVTVGAASILATFKNLKGENFKQALSLAQDLATVMGGDLSSTALFLGRALNSPATQLSALSRHGIVFTEEQKKLIQVMQESGNIAGAQGVIFEKLRTEMGGAARAVADPWTQMNNVMGDLSEQVGGVLLPFVNAISSELMNAGQTGITTFSTLRQSAQEWADFMSVAYKTMGDQVYLWYLETKLAVVQMSAEVGHFFTAQIPAWLSWLSDNWSDVFFTLGDYALTVFQNLVQNIRMLWQQVLNYFKGEPVEFDWTPLTEGAVNAIKSMPDIPDRVASEFEKRLQDDVAAQKDFLEQSQKDIFSGLQEQRAAKPAIKSLSPLHLPGSPESAPSTDTAVGAAVKGSVEAVSSILRAQADSDPTVKMIQEQEETNDLLGDLRDTLRDMQTSGVSLAIGSLV